MAKEISVVLKAYDQISGTFKSIASTSQGLSKEYEALERRAKALDQSNETMRKRMGKLSTQLIAAKKDMDAARKAFKKTGDEADGITLDKAVQEYERLREELGRTKAAADITEKSLRSTTEQMRRLFDETAVEKKKPTMDGFSKLGKGLAQSGLIRELGGSLANAAGVYMTSMIGQPDATMISSTLSGMASGASSGALIGNSIFPGLGTAIGAVLGGASGYINGKAQIYQQQDDAFKAYYAGLYDTVNANTAESLTSGKELAKSRETTRVSFTTLLGGEAAADAFLGDVLNTANTTPFLYDDLVDISKTLLSFGTAVEDVIPTLTTVGDAGAALGLSTGDIGTVATYLGRMQSSGKATLEYLNPLNERGFSVFEWLAEARTAETGQETDVGAVYELISKSELSGNWVSDVILGKFEALYGGMMAEQSRTTESLESTLQGLRENIQNAGGDAYNKTRQDAYTADIAAYGGELGEAMKSAYAAGSEAQAYGENLRDQYTREALGAVLLGEKTTVYSGEQAAKLEEMRGQYQDAQAVYNNEDTDRETRMLAAKKMEDLREEAEALATALFESSEWMKKEDDTEREHLEAIRDNTRALGLYAAKRDWNFGNWKSIGLAEGGTAKKSQAGGLSAGLDYDPDYDPAAAFLGYAYGLSYVPYDGYPAILHQGERVLTAAESRSLDAAGRAWESPPSFAYGLKYTPFDGFPAVLHQGERVLAAQEARGAGGGGQRAVNITVNVTGNTVRSEEELADLTAKRLAAALEEKAMLFGG